MRKKGFTALAVFLLLVTAAFGFAACGEKHYTVTFVTNGGAAVANVTVQEGGSITLPDTGKDGYTFVGWFDNTACTGNSLPSPYTPSGSVTLYAKFEAIPKQNYTVTFETNGGTAVTNTTVQEGGSVTLPDTNKDGYTFAGWFDNAACTGNPLPTQYTPSGNVTLYAKFEAIPKQNYTVTFVTNSGTAVTNVTVQEGGSITLPDTNKDGYTFVGWFDNEQCTGNPLSSPYTPSGNVTLYAKFTEIPKAQFTVTFVTNGGTAVTNVTVQEGGSVTLPDTSKDGYTFVGWFDNAACTGNPLPTQYTPSGSVTLYAKFNVKQDFTVTYMNGNAVFHTQTVKEGDCTNKPSNIPVKAATAQTEYIFDDWCSDAALTTPFDFANTPITANTVLYARYREAARNYTVTFKSGDDVFTTQQVAYGKSAVMPSDAPVKAATAQMEYTFAKWCSDAALTMPFDFANRTVTANITLYARFDEADLLLTYELNGNAKSYSVSGIKDKNAVAVVVPEQYNGKPVTYISQVFADCNLLESVTPPFIGAANEGINRYFAYIFGAPSVYDADKFIPASLKTVTITGGTSVPYQAFYGCSTITRVSLWGGAVSIGAQAFYNCSALQTLDNYDSLVSVAESAFRGCAALTAVSLSTTVTTIQPYTFEGCASLKNVLLPLSLTTIEESAFRGCTSLTLDAILPTTLTSIGDNAFAYCESIDRILVSNVLTTIGRYAFSNCKSMQNVYLGKNVTSIGYGAFHNCPLLKVAVDQNNARYSLQDYALIDTQTNELVLGVNGCVIPETVTSVGAYAFSGRNLTSIIIPSSVTSIGAYAFYGTSLTDIDIPLSVTSVGAYAFSKSSLTNVLLPVTVLRLGSGVFANCEQLTDVRCTVAQARHDWNWSWNNNCAATVQWGYGNVTTDAGLDYAIVNDEVYLTKYKLKGTLGSVSIPAAFDGKPVVSVGEIFSYDTSLTSMKLPDSVREIDSFAFAGCINLTTVTLSKNTTAIGDHAFYNCDFKTFQIPASVTSIGENAFEKCKRLESIVIPESVQTFGANAFYDAAALTAIFCEASVKPEGWQDEWNHSYSTVHTTHWGDTWTYVDGKPTLNSALSF